MASEPTSASAEQVPNAATEGISLGSYEELHRKCRDLFPLCFEGAKAVVQKGLSSHFQVTHTMSISQAVTGYRFGATFVGNAQATPTEAFPIILGDTDLQGNTQATVLHQMGNFRGKFQGQVQQGLLSGSQLSLEHRGRLSTYGLTVANPALNGTNCQGIFVAQMLRRITRNFDVGAEYIYHREARMPGKQTSMLSYALRYTQPNWTFSGTLASNALHLCYYHKQSEHLQFGVEFEANFKLQEANTTFAYQIEVPDSMTLRASCDTNWTVSAVLEKKLSKQLPFSLGLSGWLNHVKAQGKFGVGLIIG
uniref:Mitochondrial import receptor subunit TOM40 homolog n=1 Tax=Globodera rostochiensis TaxID=31243 RepID=A0A914HZX7_GLORO